MVEAQIMIDPESIPREADEPAPVPKGTPQDGIQKLLGMTKNKRLNPNELSQLWNLLAFGYYTLEDVEKTIFAYEEVIKIARSGPIPTALEANAYRALTQLKIATNDLEDIWNYIENAANLGDNVKTVFAQKVLSGDLSEAQCLAVLPPDRKAPASNMRSDIAFVPPDTFNKNNYLPIVKVQPQYPRRALSRGLSGWVVIEFRVNETGLVENPRVVENCAHIQDFQNPQECTNKPNNVFDKAALKAASKFEYKPRVYNGSSIATDGVRNKISFELATH
jgi:hypothetical protein